MLFLLATLSSSAQAGSYGLWQSQHFSPTEMLNPTISGQFGNPAHDGINNLLKYFQGLDPHVHAASNLPTVTVSQGTPSYSFVFDSSVSDVLYDPQVSTDLETWASGANALKLTGAALISGNIMRLTYQPTSSAGGTQFMRLGVVWTGGLTINLSGGGDQWVAPGTYSNQPVTVTPSSNTYPGTAQISVTFSANGGVFQFATSIGGTPSSSLTVPASQNGTVSAYLYSPAHPGAGALGPVSVSSVTTISVAATVSDGSNSYTQSPVTTTATLADTSVASPANVVAVPTSATSVQLSWENNSQNGTIIQQSTDGGTTWNTVATPGPGVNSYTVTGMQADMNSNLRVIASSSSGSTVNSGSVPVIAPSVTPLSIPKIVTQSSYDTLGIVGVPGFVQRVNYYLMQTWTLSIPASGSNPSYNATQTTTFDVFGNQTVSRTGSVPDSSYWGYLSTPTTVISDTVLQSNGINASLTLSIPITVDAIKTGLMTRSPPFTGSSRTASVGGTPADPFYAVQRMKYHFQVNADPSMTWSCVEVFVPADGSATAMTTRTFQGGSVTVTPDFVIDPLTSNGGKDGTYYVVWAALPDIPVNPFSYDVPNRVGIWTPQSPSTATKKYWGGGFIDALGSSGSGTWGSLVQMSLELQSTGAGAAVFDTGSASGVTSVQLQVNPQLLQIYGTRNSNSKGDTKIVAKINGTPLASKAFTVSTWPVNFNQTLAWTPVAGDLAFNYNWQSESGNSSDLGSIWIGEFVYYSDLGNHTSPPWSGGNNNPTVTGKYSTQYTNTGFTDQHVPPGKEPNTSNPLATIIAIPSSGSAASYLAQQYYGFHDGILDSANPIPTFDSQGNCLTDVSWLTGVFFGSPIHKGVDLHSPITISRFVEYVPGLNSWQYRIEKNYSTTTLTLP